MGCEEQARGEGVWQHKSQGEEEGCPACRPCSSSCLPFKLVDREELASEPLGHFGKSKSRVIRCWQKRAGPRGPQHW